MNAARDGLALGDVAEAIVDCEHKTAPTQERGIPLIRTTDIKSGRLNLKSARHVSEETFRTWSRRIEPLPDDIIIAREAPIGEVGIVPPGERVCLGQRTTLVRADRNKADPYYLLYLLCTREIKREMTNHAAGSVVQHLNVQDIRALPLPRLPELAAQRAVSTVLSCLDQKIGLIGRMNTTLVALARAIFTRWFVDFEFPDVDRRPYKSSGGGLSSSRVGDIPEGWRVGSVLDCADLLSGGTPRTEIAEYWGGRIKWVSARDVTAANGTYIVDTERKITKAGMDNSNAKLLPKNATIVTARGTVGNYCLLGEPMAINQTNYGLKGKAGYGDYFVFFTVARLVNQMRQRSYGTVFDTITTQTFSDMEISLPPLALVESFESIIAGIMNRSLGNHLEAGTLAATRDGLLPKLMSEKIRVLSEAS